MKFIGGKFGAFFFMLALAGNAGAAILSDNLTGGTVGTSLMGYPLDTGSVFWGNNRTDTGGTMNGDFIFVSGGGVKALNDSAANVYTTFNAAAQTNGYTLSAQFKANGYAGLDFYLGLTGAIDKGFFQNLTSSDVVRLAYHVGGASAGTFDWGVFIQGVLQNNDSSILTVTNIPKTNDVIQLSITCFPAYGLITGVATNVTGGYEISSSRIALSTFCPTNMLYAGLGWNGIVVSNSASPALLTSFSVVTNGYSVSTNRLSLSQAMPTMTFSDFTSVTNLADELTKYAPIDIIHGAGQSSFATVRATYPQKIVLKQDAWAGIGMDAEDLTNVYPGHLLLKLGTLLTNDCAASDTVLYVQDYTRIAGQQSVIDGITNSIESYVLLYARTNGVPDWSRAEHVKLVAVDTNAGAITVKRAQLGSKALAFTNGQAVLARHMMFWTNPNGGQWSLNFSLQCPRGGTFNMTAAEWYAWRKMQIIYTSKADGMEFDVARWQWGYAAGSPMDCDNDLVADYGYINGVNSFGLGGQLFFRRFRELLGPNKIIQMDSDDAQYQQRGWQYANGVQLESFPDANKFDRCSEAFTHLRAWVGSVTNVPAFSYAFIKVPTTLFGHVLGDDGSNVDWRFRVGFAAGLLTGMPTPFNSITDINFDPANPDYNNPNMVTQRGLFPWDEFMGGTNDLNNWKWLGGPLNGAAALQVTNDLNSSNLFTSTVWAWTTETNFSSSCTIASGTYSAVINQIPSNTIPWTTSFYTNQVPQTLWFGTRLAASSGMPAFEPGKEYTLQFEATGNDSWTNGVQVFNRVPRALTIQGIANYGNNTPTHVAIDSAWRSFSISIIADSVAPQPVIFGVSEQVGSVSLRNLRLYKGGGERWVREFTNGVVLLNMTKEPWSYNTPKAYRHFNGTQHPEINNGRRVPPSITVPVWDALFLVKTSGTNIIVPAGVIYNYSPGGLLLGTNDTLSGCGGVIGNVVVSTNAGLFAGTNSLLGGTLSFSNNLTLNGQTLTFDLSTNPAGDNNQIIVTGNVTNNGSTTISLNYLSGFLGTGTYTLMTYASRQGGTFVLDTDYPNVALNVNATSLTLTVSGGGAVSAPYVWRGTYATNVWDIATTANWLFNGQETIYNDGAGVVFDDSSANTTVNLNTTVFPGSVTVNVTNNSYTITGTGGIGGTTSLIKTGTNQLALAITNSYTGGTTIAAGTLSGTTASLQGNITNNGLLKFNQASNGIFNGVISGSGDLENSGNGMVTLTGINAYTGNTILDNSSDIIVSSDANLGAGTNIIINQNANLRTRASFATSKNITLIGASTGFDVTNGTMFTVSGVVSGSGATPRKQTGTGTLVLNGANTFATNTVFLVSAGGLSLGNPAALNNAILKFNNVNATLDNTSGSAMAPTGMRDLILTSSLTFVGTDDLDLSAMPSGFTQTVGGIRTITVTAKTLKLSGLLGSGVDAGSTPRTDGGLAKAGAGTLILTGISAYTNTTTVSAGTLLVNGTLPASPVSVSSGALLGGSGIITGAVTVASSASLIPGGSNTVGTLSFSNNLTLGSSDTLVFDITNNTGNADKIVVAGNLTNNSTTTISLHGASPVPNGTYPLMEVAGTVSGPNNFSPSGPSGKNYAIVYQVGTPNKVLLQVSGIATAKTWTGSSGVSSNLWDVNTTANWMETGGGSTSYVFTNNNTVLFDDTGATNPTVNIATMVLPASMTVNSSSNYTFVGTGFIAGTNALNKSGTGTLTLSNANTFSGGITVSAGTLALGITNATGTTAAGRGALTMNDSSQLQSANAAGTVVITNSIILNGAASFIGGSDLTIRGLVSGSGSLTLPAGVGLVLSLTNANTYTGGTTNTAAGARISVFNVNALGSSPLYMNGGQMYFNNDLKSGNAGKGITNNIVMLADSSFNFLTSDTLLSGSISGTGSITANGSVGGSGTISNDNSGWSGNFAMSDATLTLGHTNALGSGVLTLQGSNTTLGVSADLSSGNGVTNNIVLNATNSAIFNLANNLKLSGVIGGSAGFNTTLVKSGVGTLTLTSTNTYTGATVISNGTLKLAGTVTLLSNSPSISVSPGATFDVSQMTSGFSVVSGQTLSGSGTGTGNVAVATGGILSPGANGIGTLTLKNALTLAGNAVFEINKTGATLTNDQVTGIATLAYGGTLTVTNSGQALTGGEVFTLFTATAYSGSFASQILPTLASGLFWDTAKLNVDGSISVVAPPVATNQSVTILEDTATNLVLTASDANSLSLTYSIFTGPTNGSLGVLNTNSGAVTYLPGTNYNGADNFTFRVSDGSLYATGAVSITVTAVNDPPVATNQNVTTPEITATNLVLTGSDVDSPILTYAILTVPAHGSLGTLNASSGTVSYTPSVNYNGADSFTFRVSDGSLYATGTVSIAVTVRSPDVWRGDGSANVWDIGTTANWLFNGQPAKFTDGARALFDDTSTNYTVNLNVTSSPAGVSVNTSSNYTFAGTGKISGVTGLTKDGAGQLTLTTTNNYSGGTTIVAGTLKISATNLLGNITNNALLLFNQASDGTFSGVISGSGALTKQGGGILTLTGNNTFAGSITLLTGAGNTLSVASDANLGIGTNITINQNTSLKTTANMATAKSITFLGTNPNLNPSANTTLTLNGALGGSSLTLSHNGSGALTLNASNSFTSTSVFLVGTAGGTINLGNANALKGTTLKFNAGNLNLDNTTGSILTPTGIEGLELTTGFNFVGSSDLDLSGVPAGFIQTANSTRTIVVAAKTLKLGGIISSGADFSGTPRLNGNLVKDGAGTLIINDASDYWGSTTVNNGTLKLGDARALGFGFNVATNVSGTTNLSVIDLNGQSPVNEPVVFAAGSLLTNSAAGTAAIGNGLAGIAITSGGSGYGAAPGITIAVPPAGGVTATATAYLGVSLASFTISSGTNTYSKLPVVTISGGGGTNAFATAVTNASGVVTNILITNPGYGFTSAPTIAFSGGTAAGAGANPPTGAGNANNFAVGAVSYAPGSGYTSVPLVTVGSGNATMTATLSSVNLAGGTTVNAGGGEIAIAAIISGTGALTNSGAGTLTLSGSNNYVGNTVANGGALLVNGSLASDSVVTINSGATLGGRGIINGPVTVVSGGTLRPGLGGSDTSPLAITNTLSLSGTTWIAINTTNVSKASTITNIAALTLGGTLTVTNSGPALAAGNTFKLFAAASVGGTFTTTNLPGLPGGLSWDMSQFTNGTIAVAAPANTNPPVFLPSFTLGTNLVLSGSNGTYGNPYYVLSTTNMKLPRTSWTVVATNYFGAGGLFSFTNMIIPGGQSRYFILQLP